jgi:hypothetical protein
MVGVEVEVNLPKLTVIASRDIVQAQDVYTDNPTIDMCKN